MVILDVRLFKNTWFDRFAKSEGMTDDQLCRIAAEIAAGEVEANLGAGVFKKRVAREGEGKSGGYRIIMLFKDAKSRLLFVYAYPKSDRDNISQNEKKYFKKLAKDFFSYSDKDLTKLVDLGNLIEIGSSKNGEEI